MRVPGLFSRRRRALVCRDAVALMTDYLEDQLAPRERALLEAHLVHCPHCHEYLAQLRVTIKALGYVTPEDLSEQAQEDLIALYRNWRAEA